MSIGQTSKLNVLGKAAVWTGIAAVVLSIFLVVTIVETTPHQKHAEFLWRFQEWPYALCGMVFMILASLTLACSLMTRHTAAGKAGVGLAFFGCAYLATLSASGGLLIIVLMMISMRRLLEGKPELKAGLPESQADRPSGGDSEQTR
jgi:hypothetical protein